LLPIFQITVCLKKDSNTSFPDVQPFLYTNFVDYARILFS